MTDTTIRRLLTGIMLLLPAKVFLRLWLMTKREK